MENKELQIQFIKNLALALKSKVELMVDDLSLKVKIKEKSFLSSTKLLKFYENEINSIHKKVDGCFPEVTEYFDYFLQNEDDTEYDFYFERFLIKNYQDVIENCFDKFDTSEYPSAPDVKTMFDDELFILELHSANSTMNNFIICSSNAIFKHILAGKYEALVIKNREKKKRLETPMVFEKVEPDLSIGLDEIKSFKKDFLNILKSFDSQSLEKLELTRDRFFKTFAAVPFKKVPHLIDIFDNAELLILVVRDLEAEYQVNSDHIYQIADQLILILENKTNFNSKDLLNFDGKDIVDSVRKTIKKYQDEKSKNVKSVLNGLDIIQETSKAKYMDTKFDLASLGQASTNPKIILHYKLIDAKAQWKILEKEILSSNEPLNKNILSLLIDQYTASSKDRSAEQKKISNIYIDGLKSLKKQLKTIHKIKAQSDINRNSKNILEKFIYNINIRSESGKNVSIFKTNPFHYFSEVRELFTDSKIHISSELRKIKGRINKELYLDELLTRINQIVTFSSSDIPDADDYLKPYNLTFEQLIESTDKSIPIVYEIGLSLEQINFYFQNPIVNQDKFAQKATFVRLVPFHFKTKMIEYITDLQEKVEKDKNLNPSSSNTVEESNNINYESYEFFKKWFHYPLEYSPLGYYHQWQDNLKHLKSEIENNLLNLDNTKSNIYLSKLSRELIDIQKKNNTTIEEINAWYDKYNTTEEDLVKNYDYKNTLHKILNSEPISDRNAYDDDLHPDTDRLQWDFYDYNYGQIIEEALGFISEVKMDLGIITSTPNIFHDTKINESNQKSDSAINHDHKNKSSVVDDSDKTQEVLMLSKEDRDIIIAALNYLKITENGVYKLTVNKRCSIRAVLDTLKSETKITDHPITKLCIYVSDLIGAGLKSLPEKGNTYNDYGKKTIEYLKNFKT